MKLLAANHVRMMRFDARMLIRLRSHVSGLHMFDDSFICRLDSLAFLANLWKTAFLDQSKMLLDAHPPKTNACSPLQDAYRCETHAFGIGRGYNPYQCRLLAPSAGGPAAALRASEYNG
ncbi:hypothetical protein GQ602_003523 [Ophiocordyceps camponoti-floridani]|uniref:Uncharacterized protein n=1 Tax=Ophiocordyceps camponoti-floridani TaxID=2030778 RepID=A0A8H4VEB9_9HYPO|nr:hypothetical protein GQ602_003523 [Ophiocordyceps camponoti-floridani]